MKIWSFTNELRPTPGGIATYNEHMENVLRVLPADVTLFFMDPSLDRNMHSIEYLPSGIRLVRYRDTEPLSNKEIRNQFGGTSMQSAFAAYAVAKDFIQSEGSPDIIELQDYLGLGYFIAAAKHALLEPFKNVSIALVCHNPSFNIISNNQYNSTHYFTGEMERFCYTAADLVRFPSAHMQLKLSSELSLKQSAVVPHPISIACFSKSKFIRGKSSGLAFIGRLNLHKRPHELIELLDRYWADRPDVLKLTIHGRDAPHPHLHASVGGFLRNRYRRHVEAGRLTFEGSYNRDNLADKIVDARLVILPYEEEAFSYALVEALAAGKLPFITAGGGQIELLPPLLREKYSFDINNLGEFSKKIELLLGADDEELKEDWEDICRYILAKCNVSEITSQITECYGALLQVNAPISYPFIRGCAVDAVDSEKGLLKQLRNHTRGVTGLLSVVVPFYNMGEFVNATVVSILRSSYKQIEIILVDDGSYDQASIDVARRLADTFPSIVNYLRVPNSGLAEARNAGARCAKGEFIAFLDPDDVISEDYYEKSLDILRAYDNVDFVGCWVGQFDEGSDLWITYTPEFPFHLYHNTINSSSIVVRLEVFLECGLNDANFKYGMEDYEATIHMLDNGARGVVIPETLFFHRMRTGSMSNLFSRSSTDFLYSLLRKKYKALFGRYWTDLEGLAANSGHGSLVANPAFPMQSMSHESKTRELLINAIEHEFNQGNFEQVVLLGNEFFNVYPKNYICCMLVGKASQRQGLFLQAAAHFNNARSIANKGSNDAFWSSFHIAESFACGAHLEELKCELEAPEYRDKRYYDVMKNLFADLEKKSRGIIDNQNLPSVCDEEVLVLISRFLCNLSITPEDSSIFGDFSLRAGHYTEEVGKALDFGATSGTFWPTLHHLHFLAVKGRHEAMRKVRQQLLKVRSEVSHPRNVMEWLVRHLWERQRTSAAAEIWQCLADGFKSEPQTRKNGDADAWLVFGTEFLAEHFHEGEVEKANREQLFRIACHLCRLSPRNALAHFFQARYLEIDKNDFNGAGTVMAIAYAEDDTNFWAGLHLVRALQKTGESNRASLIQSRLLAEHPTHHHHLIWYFGEDCRMSGETIIE